MAYRFAVRHADDVHDAEDAVAETMLALLRALDEKSATIECVASWLRAVIRHKLTDLIRRNGRQRQVLKRRSELEIQRGDGHCDPAQPLHEADTRTVVGELMGRLSDRQQIVLELKYCEALSVRDIAVRLDETEKAVEALLYRARREFRRLYELHEASIGRLSLLPGVAAEGVPAALAADKP